ncbi:MAG: acyclic terpene utilization AtuA family protein [Pirellulales bacterium]
MGQTRRRDVAGHLIECGAQATGGYSSNWQAADLVHVGYPVAELQSDGTFVITKPPGSGGFVNRLSVASQLVYEIGNPQHYLTPDVDCDFTTVALEDLGDDRVEVTDAAGRPAPEMLKVSSAYRDGYTADGRLLVYGRDCYAKAQACAMIIFQQLADAGFEYERTYFEVLGAGPAYPACDRRLRN